MPWNPPGGQNNPWGRRPSGSNLNTRLRDWRRRLESLFGGGGAGGDGTGDGGRGGEGGSISAIVIVLALVVWVYMCLFQVKSAEVAIIQRFGKYVAAKPEGLGWRWWPIETVSKVNTQNVNSKEDRSRMLTADVNLVDLHYVVQYRYGDPIKALFRVRDPEETLREVSESAIREIVGRSELEDVLVGATRPQVTRRSKDLIQRTLDFYNTGITVTTVNLTDVQVPEAVIPSQRDANKALADQERLIKEAQAYANGIVPVAQGGAARLQQDAEGYKAKTVALAEGEASRFTQLADAYAQAPQITRKRLYLDTMETVLGRARKVVIDKSNGGNMIYLPMDKLMERSVPRAVDSSPDSGVRVSPPEQETVTVDGRTRGER